MKWLRLNHKERLPSLVPDQSPNGDFCICHCFKFTASKDLLSSRKVTQLNILVKGSWRSLILLFSLLLVPLNNLVDDVRRRHGKWRTAGGGAVGYSPHSSWTRIKTEVTAKNLSGFSLHPTQWFFSGPVALRLHPSRNLEFHCESPEERDVLGKDYREATKSWAFPVRDTRLLCWASAVLLQILGRAKTMLTRSRDLTWCERPGHDFRSIGHGT